MKLKNGFVLREVAGSCVVVPTDAALNLNGMITLNETGKILWTALTDGAETDDLVAALLAKYEIDEVTAREGVDAFVQKLRQHGFLDE